MFSEWSGDGCRKPEPRWRLNHQEVGDIDLVWGKEGSAEKNYEDGYGLAKIAKKHPGIAEKLPEIISQMTVKQKGKNKIILASNSHKGIVSLDWYGKEKKWLLTAYEINEAIVHDGKRIGGPTVIDGPLPSKDMAQPQNTPSNGKINKKEPEKKFIPTHETSEGEQVKKIGDGLYVNAEAVGLPKTGTKVEKVKRLVDLANKAKKVQALPSSQESEPSPVSALSKGQETLAGVEAGKPTVDGFILTSEGKTDFGVINDEIAQAVGINSAPIRISTKKHQHIVRPERLKQAQQNGYASVESLVEDVAKNYNSVFQGKKNTLLLAKRNGKAKIAFIELEKGDDGIFYAVNTALVSRDNFLKNKKLLWERAQTSQSIARSPSAVTGQSSSDYQGTPSNGKINKKEPEKKFIPTHETSEGEQVKKIGDGLYVNAEGVEIEDNYANEISQEEGQKIQEEKKPSDFKKKIIRNGVATAEDGTSFKIEQMPSEKFTVYKTTPDGVRDRLGAAEYDTIKEAQDRAVMAANYTGPGTTKKRGAKPNIKMEGPPPKQPGEGKDNGLQSTVSESDGETGSQDVHGTKEVGKTGRASSGKEHGSAPDGEGYVSQVRGGRDDDGPEGSSGNRVRNPDRVPGRGRGTEAVVSPVEAENHTILPGSLDEARGWKTKAKDNIEAIRLVKRIEAEGRLATSEEQAVLAKYVGWGGVKGVFQNLQGQFGKGYESLGAELKDLLTESEYKTAERSSQYAHYTAESVVRSMWAAVERLGFTGGKVFEPGMGIGNFAGMMPGDVAAKTSYHGLEFDHMTAKIAKLLYPKWGVRHDDFTKAPLPENTYDLVIGNPPFSDTAITSDPKYAKHKFFIHDYFFAKSIDAVRPGGLLAFISSAGTLNKVNTKAREYLAERADFVGAIRLPGDAFEKNAGTSVTTDIVFLRKKMDGEPAIDAEANKRWVETISVTLPKKDGGQMVGAVNAWMNENKNMVLGEEGFFDPLYENRYGVKAREGQNIDEALSKAVESLPESVMVEWNGEAKEVDFGTTEKKEGSYYIGQDGTLMQHENGLGSPVATRGPGVSGGMTKAEIEKIKKLIPIRDALRTVMLHDMSGETRLAGLARKTLNIVYDRFVKEFGPINKAQFIYKRPTAVQAEAARNDAREAAEAQGSSFDEGTFDPSEMIAAGATNTKIAKARAKAREQAGKEWSDGDFDPTSMEDIVIDRRPNIDPFMFDPESYRLRAIEKYDDVTGLSSKGLIFTESLISKETEPKISSVNDALLYVLNKAGRVDIKKIAEAAKVTQDKAIKDLGENIFLLPGTKDSWVTKEEYLSGNVKKKLRAALVASRKNQDYRGNVDALEEVQPKPLPASDITASLGMNWIPTEVIENFATDGLGLEHAKIKYTKSISFWNVEGDDYSSASTSTWGTEDKNAIQILKDALNRQAPKIFRTEWVDGKKKSVLDVVATQAATDKVSDMKERFKEWVFGTPERTEELSTLYNEKFNNVVVRKYNGDYLTTPGISSTWKWRPHQSAVVSRIIQTGNTYMAHSVGSGKTSAMIGAGMEMRRLGLVKKPMYAVPNHMLSQFTKEFYEQYPLAKIAVADEKRFHTNRRKQFIANVANDDLDAIIITHSAFGKIPISGEFQDNLIQEQIQAHLDVVAEVEAEEGVKTNRAGKKIPSLTVRKIQNTIEKLEQRLSGKGNNRADQVFTFEEMGIDFLFIDEAHEFRKLDFATKQSDLKGIDPSGSKKAWDLFVKTRYLETINPGRNLVLASGTPVTNTMGELYTVSRYMQPGVLVEHGLQNFDDWANAFGESKDITEQTPSGGYKQVSRFAKFVNVPELSNMVRLNMDVITTNQLDQYVTRPALKSGKRILNVAERSEEQIAYQEVLGQRMEAIANRKGPPAKGDDIMLSVINDGRLAAIDMRFIDKNAKPDPNSKINLMLENVFRIWKETKNHTFYKPGTNEVVDKGPAAQMIFANLGVNNTRGFSGYSWMVQNLVSRGVPRNQIAIIGDYKSHSAKQALFKDVNSGKIRILIGSSAKMGTGVNAQQRLYALHNQDPLWYPADDDQRVGRILRQGNLNKEIEVHDYTTKGTYDSTMWGMMETKAKFIQGFFEGDPDLRVMDDLGAASVYEQAKAISTADERVIKLTELKQALERSVRRGRAHQRDQANIAYQVREAKKTIALSERGIQSVSQDLSQREDTKGKDFSILIDRQSFSVRVEAGAELQAQRDSIAEGGVSVDGKIVGKFAGFPVKVFFDAKSGKEAEFYLEGLSGNQYNFYVGSSAKGAIASMERAVASLNNELAYHQNRKQKAEKALRDYEPQLGKEFTGKEEIERLQDEVKKLDAELIASSKDAEKKPDTEPDSKTEEDSNKDPADKAGFSISEVDGPDTTSFSTISKSDKMKPRGITIDELKEVVEEVLKEFEAGILRNGVTIHARKFANAKLRENARSKGIDPDTIKGAYLQRSRRSYIFAANLSSRVDAKETLIHELVIHHGLNLLAPNDKRAFLEKIIDSKEVGFVKPIWTDITENAKEADDFQVAEEVFAYITEKYADKTPPLWDRILFAMVRVFRKVGLIFKPITKIEMHAFARDLAQGIREGKPQLTIPKSDNAQFSLLSRIKNAKENISPENRNEMWRDAKDNHRPTWLGLLGGRQLLDIYRRVIPNRGTLNPAIHYQNLLQNMDAYVNDVSGKAGALADRWIGLPKEVRDSMADLMNKATIYEYHPDSSRINDSWLKEAESEAGYYEKKLSTFNQRTATEAEKIENAEAKVQLKKWREAAKFEQERLDSFAQAQKEWRELSQEAQEIFKQVERSYSKATTDMQEAIECAGSA
ncbi:MAG: N-6 DNA methylase [Magnetococcales bacterium]|nr:N-6 DNA methylase [Magnetococcales bacterium]